MNINGEIRYKSAFHGNTICLYFYVFIFKTINLSEFEVPIDTQESCLVSN